MVRQYTLFLAQGEKNPGSDAVAQAHICGIIC